MSEKMSAPLVVAKKTKVPKMKITTAAVSKPTYSAMVTKAIVELKEKKGSSRSSIMKYLIANYKVILDLDCVIRVSDFLISA